MITYTLIYLYRTLSQPDLGRAPDSPNYQNYPGEQPPPGHRHGAQHNHAGPNTPVSAAGIPGNRPRSEFVDPNWYPPPPAADDRQPIYQNQMMGKPAHQPNSRLEFNKYCLVGISTVYLSVNN